jgi:CheY-like chemotaxis protein
MLDENYVRKHTGLAAGEYVAIEVTDSGGGMTPDVQAKAIEPFFTTKEEGKGTGLGLSMVFGFAKQSGGHVRIYSEVGQGTTITLLLPRADGAAASEATDQRMPTAPRAKSGETVLVVDDNAALLRVAVTQLKALGYQVLQAGDGPSALELLKEKPQIDFLLTDIIMPGGLSGVDLGHEAQRMLPQLRLMYMSGFPEAAFGDDARLDQQVILVRKPFRQAELALRVREALGRGVEGTVDGN